jgi:hypothetical protein
MVPIWIGALLFLSGILFMAAQTRIARPAQRWTASFSGTKRYLGAQEPFAGVRHESELARVCARRARHRSHARGSGLLTPRGAGTEGQGTSRASGASS